MSDEQPVQYIDLNWTESMRVDVLEGIETGVNEEKVHSKPARPE